MTRTHTEHDEKLRIMEELTLTTPSILFSAISLIMLAYTNRFLAYAQVIRNLKKEHEARPSPIARQQIDNLRKRLYMARSMQLFGVSRLVVVRVVYSVGIHRVADGLRCTRSAWRCCCCASRWRFPSANC